MCSTLLGRNKHHHYCIKNLKKEKKHLKCCTIVFLSLYLSLVKRLLLLLSPSSLPSAFPRNSPTPPLTTTVVAVPLVAAYPALVDTLLEEASLVLADRLPAAAFLVSVDTLQVAAYRVAAYRVGAYPAACLGRKPSELPSSAALAASRPFPARRRRGRGRRAPREPGLGPWRGCPGRQLCPYLGRLGWQPTS